MPPTKRPYQILQLPDKYFNGGSHLSEAGEDGLQAIVLGLAERAPIRSIVGSNRLVTAADEGAIFEMDPDSGTVDLQLPAGLPVGFIAVVRQVGTGTVRVVASGSTVEAVASATTPLVLAEDRAQATVEVRATNTWLVTGQLG